MKIDSASFWDTHASPPPSLMSNLMNCLFAARSGGISGWFWATTDMENTKKSHRMYMVFIAVSLLLNKRVETMGSCQVSRQLGSSATLKTLKGNRRSFTAFRITLLWVSGSEVADFNQERWRGIPLADLPHDSPRSRLIFYSSSRRNCRASDHFSSSMPSPVTAEMAWNSSFLRFTCAASFLSLSGLAESTLVAQTIMVLLAKGW